MTKATLGDITTRLCSGCHRNLPRTGQYWSPNKRRKDGLDTWRCKDCRARTQHAQFKKKGRLIPLGYRWYTPRKGSPQWRIFQELPGIWETYANDLPLTVRQIYYRLVALDVIDKTPEAYNKVADVLKYCRQNLNPDYCVPWETIRDDTIVTINPPRNFDDAREFIDAYTPDPRRFSCSLLDNQMYNLEIVVEAGGMASQIAEVARPYGIRVTGSGGFDSVTGKHELYRRCANDPYSRPTKILHLGDCDKHGKFIYGALERSIASYAEHEGGEVEFVRVALLEDHIDRYHLPTDPDHPDTVQLEAMDPPIIKQVLRQAIADWWNDEAQAEMEAYIAEERQKVVDYRKRVDGLGPPA